MATKLLRDVPTVEDAPQSVGAPASRSSSRPSGGAAKASPAKPSIPSAANLAIWDALSKTDPAQTKQFSRAGGFKGTAVKPIWITQRLTEQFGPCGEGWGIGEPKFEWIPACEGEALVYCTVSCWHGSPENTLYGVGGDKVMTTRRDGTIFVDDEAYKKAFTDAIGNAFKFIGVAADIHMGLFDDSKYIAEVQAEFAGNGKVVGIHKIKEHLRILLTKGSACETLDAFNELVSENKADLRTIRDANHEWWTGDGDDFEGFKAFIKRRREELNDAPSLAYQLLVSTLDECTSSNELKGWLAKNGDVVAELDGEESRNFEKIYDDKAAALKLVDTASAG